MDFADESDAVGSRGVDGAAGEEVVLGVFEAESVDPHHGGGQAVDTAGGVTDVGVVGHEEQVGAHDEVGGAADGPACDFGDDGFGALPQRHEPADVVVHELVVAHGVPVARSRFWAGGVVGSVPGIWLGGAGELIDRAEVITSGEAATGTSEHDGADVDRGSGLRNGIGDALDHVVGEGVELVGPVEGDDGDAVFFGVEHGWFAHRCSAPL